MATGEVVIKVKADTKSFDKQIYKLEKDLEELENKKYKIDLGKDDGDIDDIEAKIEKVKNKLMGLRQEKEKLNQTGFQDTNTSLSDIGNKIETIIKKVGKWALAVFSVRSAYNLIRQASSTLSQYNEQYANNLEYIRFALAQALAPVLEYIVNLARTLLAYINYIASAWFGVNLFANASAKSFAKVKNNIGGATKSAKELQKTLAGFDEMNILNSTSTGGGGGVGGGTPNFDLSDLNQITMPKWIDWIAQNKQKIIDGIIAIATAFLIFKTLKIAGILDGIGEAFIVLVRYLGVFKTTILALGITAIFVGIGVAIKGVINFIKDPSWENFKTILYGLEIAVAGLSVALIALNATNPVGWIILAIDGVALLTTKIIDLVKHENKEVDTKKLVIQQEEKLKEARENLKSVTDEYINSVEEAENREKELKKAQDDTGISIDDLLDKMEQENLTYKDLDENQRKVYKAYIQNEEAQKKLTDTTDKFNKAQKDEQGEVFKTIKFIEKSSNSYDEYKKAIIQAYEKGTLSAKDASMAIMRAMENMDDKTKETFTNDLPKNIKEGLNPDTYASWANDFKYWWNNKFLGGITTSLILNINTDTSKMKGFNVGGFVTKMATGGLINMPGRGVPVSNAIAR